MPFFEKGNVRIRYEEAGSGFPLLVTPGGGLNSRVSNWPNAVFNSMEIFKDEFRCITMDQRNANGGESSGPIPAGDPWGAFADDQLALMDHLGIKQFFFMGYCIGGCFAMKLMERAPERVVAAVLVQTVGHHPQHPDYMYNSGRDVWAPELLARRPDLDSPRCHPRRRNSAPPPELAESREGAASHRHHRSTRHRSKGCRTGSLEPCP